MGYEFNLYQNAFDQNNNVVVGRRVSRKSAFSTTRYTRVSLVGPPLDVSPRNGNARKHCAQIPEKK